ncbi:MAG: hypothetical protein JNK75_11155 [Betaproteobacteria bacterium]|nr:hypothetical protein [Betaproteobacteria bacterium]
MNCTERKYGWSNGRPKGVALPSCTLNSPLLTCTPNCVSDHSAAPPVAAA